MKRKIIDLHSHVLPGVDDGAKCVEDSILMLEDAFLQNVGICAATPHCVVHRSGDIERFLAGRERSFKKLSEELNIRGSEFPRVILGAEVYLDNDLNKYEGIERLCLEGSEYIMLEFPIANADVRWSEWIYNLNRKGIKVLVAHVDRYPQWEKMMADFKGLDVKYQVNASRFLELSSGKLLKSLMNCGQEYCISSDMHNMKARRCNLAKAYEKAMKKYPDRVEELFCGNAKEILGIS